MSTLRDNWRVGLLVVVLLLSTVFLFAPGFAGGAETPAAPANGTAGNATDGSLTNLKYGLQLSGGTRIRAPLVGVTAEGVEFGNATPAQVERTVAGEITGVGATDLIARRTTQTTGTVELVTENASQDTLTAALDAAGYSYETVGDGVTEATLEETVNVLQSKINEAGLSGGDVQTVTTAGGQTFVRVQVPNQDRSDVLDLVNSRGTVQVLAYHPVERNGSTTYVNTTVLTQSDFQRIGSAQQGSPSTGGRPFVQVAVRQERATEVQQTLIDTGVARTGGTTCTFQANPNGTQPCLLLVRDGRVVNSFGMGSDLAAPMQSGEWAEDPTFILLTTNFSDAQQVAVDLRAGALPAQLDVGPNGSGSSSYISPAQGEDFKRDSLIIGLLAVLTVSVVVFFRYGEVEVAAPMVVTAMAEVYALLGFAALIQYPLDLSVIAGFIAVIGTGVDDLVIIADEVMSEGEVNSRRVFQSRFRKAFWVIGAAAATTIIAMSPLAVLSLGDLQGFAIFTILGVLVGVLVTRPAYGDILRSLLTGR
ncbi:preprotein translocase subunit SecD [Candidatus Halobonum tyrrellensis]|uniref:Protein-export membrane protein SecD n=1 Tax=Candidatus Halobonum tyrrellensis G22 TaxID=1324957 RepID=V4HBF6_9EURY|nr:preprotein translocase subunit SecD [Candidatus Halobonum tyrrellensis]ESP87373.1 preprotein translocase subunit SecD [Candidatus Halobonum tyrrellensis G22]